METNKSDIQAAIDAGMQLAIAPIDINGTPHISTPKEWITIGYEELREKPLRIKSNIRHSTHQSFVDYINKFGNEDTAIFIDTSNDAFVAVIDYHGNQPDWCQHQAVFVPTKTVEFNEWKSKNAAKMNQESFAQFIENNLPDITEPNGATMLEIAKSLKVNTSAKFSKAIQLQNGQVQLEYNEQIDGSAGPKGDLKIPEKFTVGIQIFEGGEGYAIDANLRYSINSGDLKIWYELIRPHKSVQANLAEIEALIAEKITTGSIYHATL